MSTRTFIDMDLISLVLADRPVQVELSEKKGWLKLECRGNRVYIAKVAKVRDIHLAGTEWDAPGVDNAKDLGNGSVWGHLDLAHPDALCHLVAILEEMPNLPEFKIVRGKKKASSSPTPPPVQLSEDMSKEERLEAIKQAQRDRALLSAE